MYRPFRQKFHTTIVKLRRRWLLLLLLALLVTAGMATAETKLNPQLPKSPGPIAAVGASVDPSPPPSQSPTSTIPEQPNPPASNYLGQPVVTFTVPYLESQAPSQTLATDTPTATPHPAPVTSPDPPAPDPGQNFGISPGGALMYLSTSELDSQLQGIRNLGVKWVRFDVDWSQIQPTSTTYDWASTDQVVAALKTYGLNGLAIIDYTPAWARASDCNTSYKCRPADPSTYAAFAAAAAARYGPEGVRSWEIWNEPDTVDFNLSSNNAIDYTGMLKASYTAIKNVEPSSTVLTSGTPGTSGVTITPTDFLSAIYADGGGGYFDAVSEHPYTTPYLPSYTPGSDWQHLSSGSPSIRSIMIANGDAAKKIWITEYGSPTNGPGIGASLGNTLAESGDDHVTEALQAQMLTDAVSLLKSSPWAGPFFWYSYIDAGTATDTTGNFYGLLRADGSQKPAYAAYQSAIAQY